MRSLDSLPDHLAITVMLLMYYYTCHRIFNVRTVNRRTDGKCITISHQVFSARTDSTNFINLCELVTESFAYMKQILFSKAGHFTKSAT